MTNKTPERFKNTQQVWVRKSELIYARIAFVMTLTALLVAIAGMFLIRSTCP